MNRTRIEWCDLTWNPITGCNRGCPYCYARRMAYRLRGRAGYPQDEPFRPTFHADRLNEPAELRTPSRIFTCSMGEFFEPDMEYARSKVFDAIERANWHTYQILTKRHEDAFDFDVSHLPIWLGTSISGLGGYGEVRAALVNTAHFEARQVFVSFEPLLGPIESFIPKGISWVIIGAQTGPSAIAPRPEWVQDLIDKARRADAAVFLKNNLHWPEKIQEWPEEEPTPGATTTPGGKSTQ